MKIKANRKPTLEELKQAQFSSSATRDTSVVKVDGVYYNKVKMDGWQRQTLSAHSLSPAISTKDLFEIIKRANVVSIDLE